MYSCMIKSRRILHVPSIATGITSLLYGLSIMYGPFEHVYFQYYAASSRSLLSNALAGAVDNSESGVAARGAGVEDGGSAGRRFILD